MAKVRSHIKDLIHVLLKIRHDSFRTGLHNIWTMGYIWPSKAIYLAHKIFFLVGVEILLLSSSGGLTISLETCQENTPSLPVPLRMGTVTMPLHFSSYHQANRLESNTVSYTDILCSTVT
jgi:hypothetical protein